MIVGSIILLVLASLAQARVRIIGGARTQIRDVPYLVAIRYMNHQFCGGAILTKYHILTAAHCFDGWDYRKFKIRAGSSFSSSGGVERRICSVKKHEHYNETGFQNDIAIIKMCYPLPSNGLIHAISPSNIPMYEIQNQKALVSGWGSLEEDGPMSDSLQSVVVIILPLEFCQKTYPHLTENGMCAGYPEEGLKDSCQGDSGGPLVLYTKVVGIVSSGIGCGRKGVPGIYTNVFRYLDWIHQAIRF